MIDVLLICILIVILAAASAYIYKAKKSGKKCIGCPEGCSCGSSQTGKGRTSCSGCKSTHNT